MQASLVQDFDKEDIEQATHPAVTVAPHLAKTIGVAIANGGETEHFCRLLESDTALPARKTAQFDVTADGDVLVKICEGAREIVVTKPEKTAKPEKTEDEDDAGETLLGFARIYSGTIRVGTNVICVLPKYNRALGPMHPANAQHLVKAPIEQLYTMMGRELVPVESVPAGNVFAVRGLEGKVWRNATLCAPATGGVRAESISAHQECLVNMAGILRYVSLILSVSTWH